MLRLEFLQIAKQLVSLVFISPELMSLRDHLVEVDLVLENNLLEQIDEVICKHFDVNIRINQEKDIICKFT